MPQDIHALEIEFAKNPTLDACLPLCEAYLGAKRYMEAMVVCKKGIKSGAVSDHRGRLMLARVFFEQGKVPKAEQELRQLSAEFPAQPDVMSLFGLALLDQGKTSDAVALLNQALSLNPTLTAARAALQRIGAALPGAAAPAATAAPATAAAPPAPPPVPAAAMPPAMPGQARPPAAAVAAPGAARPAPTPIPAPAPATPAFDPPAEGAPRGGAPKMNDFFAPESLGFSDENSEVETAGPGRLTILGFVPKSSGSLKTTLAVFVGVLAVVGLYLTLQIMHSRRETQIAKTFGLARAALDEDRYGRYKDVLKHGEQILKLEPQHALALSAMAYSSAVLATDHQEPNALDSAHTLIARVPKVPENEFAVAARALIAYADRSFEPGIAEIKAVLDKGGTRPLVVLEAFRLMDAVRPEDPNTRVQLRILTQSATHEPRLFTYIGWYYYDQDDWNHAGKYFDQALQNSKGHPMALLGRSSVALSQGIGLAEKQKDVERDLKEVLALPPADLSAPVAAMAHFVQSQLWRWQGEQSKAETEYQLAIKLDPKNPRLPMRRSIALLEGGDAKQAAAGLAPVFAAAPDNVRVGKKLAQAQIAAGQFVDAKNVLEKLAQKPRDYEVFLLQGDLALGQHDLDEAIKSYQRITRDDGPDPFSLGQLATTAAMRQGNDKERASKFMESYLSKLPEAVSQPVQAKLWCELGQAYEAQGNRAKAVQSFENGVEQFRFDASCQIALCRIHGGDPCKTYLSLEPHGKFAAEAQSRAH